MMNILHIIYVYQQLKANKTFRENYYPHTFIFGAKAAPSYYVAKKTIQLICTIAHLINEDNEVNDKLKVVFIPNYNVTWSEYLVPACDVSEQISTAGKEASGTGNMKFMFNGAITIGTLDGANVEIAKLVGKDNIVTFGLTSDEVKALHATNSYHPYDVYAANPSLKAVLDFIVSLPDADFYDLRNNLLNSDYFLALQDFESYKAAHATINDLYKDQPNWGKKMIINVSKASYFSTDRTITEYNNDIWKTKTIA
jgi:starch phosphorylase